MNLDRGPRFVCGMANRLQLAIDALGLARNAYSASVPDYAMGKVDPLVTGNHSHKVLLNILRIVVLGQLKTARDSMHVRIDHNSFSFSEPRPQHDIGGLARCA